MRFVATTRATSTIAPQHGVGFVLDTRPGVPTGLGREAGLLSGGARRGNRAAVALLEAIRAETATPGRSSSRRRSGRAATATGRTDDGRRRGCRLPRAAGRGASRRSGADMVGGLHARPTWRRRSASRGREAPGCRSAISFTVETDGGCRAASIRRRGRRIDDATGGPPVYYMINCAHPTPFRRRARGRRLARADPRHARQRSKLSHAELDEAAELDSGDPGELGRRIPGAAGRCPLEVVGGCCGTDHRHIEKICAAFG